MQYRIPLVNLKYDPAETAPFYAVQDAIHRVLESGSYVSGKEVEAFEVEWAAYCKAKYCVGLSSCSDALYLVLRYCKEQLGYSNVATTPVSFWATTESILRAGMQPVFYDIEDHGCVDLEKAGVMCDGVCLPVNLYGYPAPPPPEFSYPVIEDAAQSHGQPLRGWAACHSFYPTKNLGAMGQAGSVVTDDENLAKWVRHMRGHAQTERRFIHDAVSGNWRMDEIQAAILRAKLPFLDGWNQRRRAIAARYRAGLAGIPRIQILPDHPDHVYHIFGVRVPDSGYEAHRGWQRKHLVRSLAECGIETGVRYPWPLHKMLKNDKALALPNAEEWCYEVLNLPIYPGLTDGQVDEVVAAIREWGERG